MPLEWRENSQKHRNNGGKRWAPRDPGKLGLQEEGVVSRDTVTESQSVKTDGESQSVKTDGARETLQ